MEEKSKIQQQNSKPKPESEPNRLDTLFNEQIKSKQQLLTQHQLEREEWLDQAIIENDQYLDWAYENREYSHALRREIPYGRGWVF